MASLKRGVSDQSEGEELLEILEPKRRRYSQTGSSKEEIEDEIPDSRAPDTTFESVEDLSATDETAKTDLVTTAVEQGVPEVDNNNESLKSSTEPTAASTNTESEKPANSEVTESESSNTKSVNNTQTTEQVRKANFRHDKLYRLLRRNENAKDEGIRAQIPNANVTIHKHVSEGSSNGSQYISTSASWGSILAWARNKKAFPKHIATIDVAKLEDCGGVKFIDLTDERMRQLHLKDQRAKNLTRKYEEVLITGVIPASCIIDVNTLSEPDSDSDSYNLYCDSDESRDSDSDDDWW